MQLKRPVQTRFRCASTYRLKACYELCEDIADSGEPEAGESDEMQSCQGFRQSFIVPGEAAEPGSPGEEPFHNPSTGQQNEAFASFRQLDHLQADALVLGRRGWPLASIALVDEGQFDMPV